jgi:hypothetical protein
MTLCVIHDQHTTCFGDGYGMRSMPATIFDMKEPNERTAKLTSVPTETEAAIVIAALEDEGIRAESDEFTSGLRAGPWNWVVIMVAERDLVKAQEVLAKVQEENDHIDWSQVDVGQPEDKDE